MSKLISNTAPLYCKAKLILNSVEVEVNACASCLQNEIFRTAEFLDKTSHVAEKTLVMTIDNTQETKIEKLSFLCFPLTSAKAKNFKMATYTTISLQLQIFQKSRHNWLLSICVIFTRSRHGIGGLKNNKG